MQKVFGKILCQLILRLAICAGKAVVCSYKHSSVRLAPRAAPRKFGAIQPHQTFPTPPDSPSLPALTPQLTRCLRRRNLTSCHHTARRPTEPSLTRFSTLHLIELHLTARRTSPDLTSLHLNPTSPSTPPCAHEPMAQRTGATRGRCVHRDSNSKTLTLRHRKSCNWGGAASSGAGRAWSDGAGKE